MVFGFGSSLQFPSHILRMVSSYEKFFDRIVKYLSVTYIYEKYAAAQLIGALWYKPEGCGFNFRWSFLDFSSTLFFRPQYIPGVDPVSQKKEVLGILPTDGGGGG
jgi:hypothetical protein